MDFETNQIINDVVPTYSITSTPPNATIRGKTITCGNTSGYVTVQAVATGTEYFTETNSSTFEINNLQGQVITFKGNGESGGLRDLPLSRRPIPLGSMASSELKSTDLLSAWEQISILEFAGGVNVR